MRVNVYKEVSVFVLFVLTKLSLDRPGHTWNTLDVPHSHWPGRAGLAETPPAPRAGPGQSLGSSARARLSLSLSVLTNTASRSPAGTQPGILVSVKPSVTSSHLTVRARMMRAVSTAGEGSVIMTDGD